MSEDENIQRSQPLYERNFFPNTLWGEFKRTREQRLLVALLLYMAGYLMSVVVLFYFVSTINSVGVLNISQVSFKPGFVVIALSTWCFLAGSIAARRTQTLIPLIFAACFLTFLAYVKP